MTGKFQIPVVKNADFIQDEKQEFMHDVLVGLDKVDKQIQSKYFYDERGSELFNQITHHPDYYLTGSELEILNTYKKELSIFLQNEPFNLIELGPGEGIKTQLLIDQFLEDHLSFTYFTIDISRKYLTQLIDNFNKKLPDLETIALNVDYLSGVKWLGENTNKRNFLLFLGSSIGNFDLNASRQFLTMIRSFLHPGDYVLIGFDLLKDIHVLMRAYNDSDGITDAFNLNLLRRINEELGANFNIKSFEHYGTYNVHSKAMESYLISNKEQHIYIDSLKRSFSFKEFEAIYVEASQKYTLPQIEELALSTQFKVIKNFTDSKHYFVNSLWCV